MVYEETLTEALICCAAALMRYSAEAARSSRCPPLSTMPSGHKQTVEDIPTASPATSPQIPPPRMILAMEKRWCFTLRDLDSRAPAYDHLLSLIDVVTGEGQALEAAVSATGEASCDDGWEGWGEGGRAAPSSFASAAGPGGSVPIPPVKKLLRGRRIDVESIPQRLLGYHRGPDLELWELCLAD